MELPHASITTFPAKKALGEAVLNQIYEERMEYFHKEYQRAIDSYADAANIDIDQLGNAYAGLDFFFNTRIRNKAYNEVYQKIREFIRQLHQESYHFNLLRENQGRFSICADKAYQICQYAFMEKNDEASDAWKKIIYQGLYQYYYGVLLTLPQVLF